MNRGPADIKEKVEIRQALFLIFNSLNTAKESTKNLPFLKVVKKVGNLYIEDIGN